MTTKTTTKTASISLEEMVDLRGKGLSLTQIGKMAGISKQAISQTLRRSGLAPEEIGQFKKDKSLILHAKQRTLLDHITPERVKVMTVRDATVAFGIIYDKARLQDDKSTANVHNYTAIDLNVYKNPPVAPYQAETLCPSCRVFTAGVEGGLCETCRTDIKARRAEAVPALSAPEANGGNNGAK